MNLFCIKKMGYLNFFFPGFDMNCLKKQQEFFFFLFGSAGLEGPGPGRAEVPLSQPFQEQPRPAAAKSFIRISLERGSNSLGLARLLTRSFREA